MYVLLGVQTLYMGAACEKYTEELNKVYDSDMVRKEEQRNKVCHTHTHIHVNYVSNLRHAMPCHAMPLPCRVRCRVVPYRTMPCHGPCHAVSCIVSCHAVPCRCHVVSCSVVPCRSVPRCAMPCHVPCSVVPSLPFYII